MFLLKLPRMNKIAYFILIITLFTNCIKEVMAQEVLKTSMLEEVNKLRRSGCQCGKETMPPVPGLIWNEQLEKAAGRHAKDMSRNNMTGHAGSNGSSPDERITGAGYHWSKCGENVANGYNSVKEVVEGWKTSPGHCRNMMDAGFRELGAAREGTYWVQDFGRVQQKKKKFEPRK
jgi:uncharacterized protein YkwD